MNDPPEGTADKGAGIGTVPILVESVVDVLELAPEARQRDPIARTLGGERVRLAFGVVGGSGCTPPRVRSVGAT
jgi:hypothetical protein